MKLMSKIMAFFLILVWGMLTLIFCVSIVPAIVLGAAEKWSDWFCGGRRLIEKIVE